MKEVCTKCERKMHVHEIGVWALEFKDKSLTQPYKLWRGDLMKCPVCGYLAITRFADRPIMGEWDEEFYKKIQEIQRPQDILSPGEKIYKFF